MRELTDDKDHPELPDLVDLARGELPRGPAWRVRLHCAVCDDCAAQLEVVQVLRRGLGLPCAGDLRLARAAGVAVH